MRGLLADCSPALCILLFFVYTVGCKHTLVVTSAPAYLFTPVMVTIGTDAFGIKSKHQVVCPAAQQDYMCGQSVNCGTVDVTQTINTYFVSVCSETLVGRRLGRSNGGAMALPYHDLGNSPTRAGLGVHAVRFRVTPVQQQSQGGSSPVPLSVVSTILDSTAAAWCTGVPYTTADVELKEVRMMMRRGRGRKLIVTSPVCRVVALWLLTRPWSGL